MNARNSNRVSMFRAIIAYCLSNPAITATIAAFAMVFTAMQNQLSFISQNDRILLNGTKGVTSDTRRDRSIMTVLGRRIANAVLAFANEAGNETLAQSVNYTLSQLNRLKKEHIIDVCRIILDAATTNLANINAYGITAIELSDFQTSINNYATTMQAPRSASADRKQAKSKLDSQIKDFEENLLKKKLDPMVRTLETTYPDFASGYFTRRAIVDNGKNHTKFGGSITDNNGTPLKGVTITIRQYDSNVSYTATTNFSGVFMIDGILAGDYSVDIERNGYQSITEQGVHFTPGRAVDRTFQLSLVA